MAKEIILHDKQLQWGGALEYARKKATNNGSTGVKVALNKNTIAFNGEKEVTNSRQKGARRAKESCAKLWR